MGTSIDRQELTQLIREILRDDPSIILDALFSLENQEVMELAGISEADRAIVDRVFSKYRQVLGNLA